MNHQTEEEQRQEKKDIMKMQEYLVVKDNTLIDSVYPYMTYINNKKYTLSALEQKVLAFIISMIKPSDTDIESLQEIELSFVIGLFCKICGIDVGNGKNYRNIKKAVLNIMNNSFWLSSSPDEEFVFRWIDKARILKKSGIISLKISSEILPYLYNLKKNFTQYELIQILGLKSSYSIFFYELLKRNLFKHTVVITLRELRKRLALEDKYSLFGDLRRNVVDIAVHEINEYTNLKVTYQMQKQGKKIDAFVFQVSAKSKREIEYAKYKTLCRIGTTKEISKYASVIEQYYES